MLIADEPTTALDVTMQAQILDLIKELQGKYGMAVVLITHDLTVVRQFSDYVYVMQDGEVEGAQPHRSAVRQSAARLHPPLARLRAQGHRQSAARRTDVCIEGRGVKVAFTLKRGTFFKPDFFELVAVDSLSLKLQRHETLGLVGEVGIGQDHLRAGADPADQQPGR